MGANLMRVLILGGTGMAGHTISLYFQEAGHDVTVFSRRKISLFKNIKIRIYKRNSRYNQHSFQL